MLVGLGIVLPGPAAGWLTPGRGGNASARRSAPAWSRARRISATRPTATAPVTPSNWVVGKPGEELDALILVAGDHRDPVSRRADGLQQRIERAGIAVAYREDGNVRQDDDAGDTRGQEHFGFEDGVSQPAIRGRIRTGGEERLISPRNIDPRVQPQTWLYGRPGQALLWPGEFLLGQPAPAPTRSCPDRSASVCALDAQRLVPRVPPPAARRRAVLADHA